MIRDGYHAVEWVRRLEARSDGVRSFTGMSCAMQAAMRTTYLQQSGLICLGIPSTSAASGICLQESQDDGRSDSSTVWLIRDTICGIITRSSVSEYPW